MNGSQLSIVLACRRMGLVTFCKVRGVQVHFASDFEVALYKQVFVDFCTKLV